MGIIAEFKQGCSDGWRMYWSPFAGLFHMARDIVSPERQDKPVYAS